MEVNNAIDEKKVLTVNNEDEVFELEQEQHADGKPLDHWPTGVRDVTEFPSFEFSFSSLEPEADLLISKKHFEGFLKLDGVDANDYQKQEDLSGLDFTPQRFRSYRKLYERVGMTFREGDKLRLSQLGREIRDLKMGMTAELTEFAETRKNYFVNKIRRQAVAILGRDQLDNPTESQQARLPQGCDVFPFRCIWAAMLGLDEKLHYQEINRVLLRVMKMEHLPLAIEKIRKGREHDYSQLDEVGLTRVLGERVISDQEQARIASWFSLAGWGGLIIERTNRSDGFRHLVPEGADLVRKELIDQPKFFKANTEDEWFEHYLSGAVSESRFSGMDHTSPYRSVLLAVRTKPFVLLAGLSGTGKSRLVRTLAFNTCHDPLLQTDVSKPGNFELIPVKPNWHDSAELMGYISRINDEKYLTTAFLKFIAKAWRFTEIPFFLCLDEMNLAPVEQYFAEYLSIVETRVAYGGRIRSDYLLARSQFENPKLYQEILNDLGLAGDATFAEGISIPPNLVVIGTVNMDETTHSFSRKVLDRAMTFEMNIVHLNAGLDEGVSDWSYPDKFISAQDVLGEFSAGSEVVNKFGESVDVVNYLMRVNDILEGSPFKIAYRVRDEFLIYSYYSSLLGGHDWLDTALDELTVMKILSRIEGDESKTAGVLAGLDGILNENFRKSKSKLDEMRDRLQMCGYTSFWS